MSLFFCVSCDDGPCEVQALYHDRAPVRCPFGMDGNPRWRDIPSGLPVVAESLPVGAGLVCEIPPAAIIAARAEGGRYTLEIGGADRLMIACSRTVFEDAIRAMERAHGVA